uniref:Uncharacterized protein n=1 Tax=Oryza rufipogon TaxID=4529 RepID=A0A0E0QXZ2_ORYRU
MAFLSSCSSFSSRQRVASQLMGALPGGTLSRPLANPSIFSASGDLASYRLSVSPIFASSSAVLYVYLLAADQKGFAMVAWLSKLATAAKRGGTS